MASYAECLVQAREKVRNAARIEKDLAADIERWREVEAKTSDDAERVRAKATVSAIDERVRQLMKRKQQVAQQAAALTDVLETAKAHPNGWGTGLVSQMVRDLTEMATKNVEASAYAIKAVAHGKFAEAIDALQTRHFGWTQDKALLMDMARELRGKDTGNARAKELAKGWTEAAEYLRDRFNRAGGDIKKRNDWGFVQTHDRLKVRAVAKEEWVEFVRPLVDRRRMFNAKGQLLDEDELTEVLGGMYDAIRTGGGSLGFGPSAVKNRHLQPRNLAFDGADAWEAYNGRFGDEDVFGAMMGHIDKLSTEIALMERFGPNPEATYQAVRAEVAKNGYGSGGFLSRVVSEDTKLVAMDSMWSELTGQSHEIVNIGVANFFGAVRHWLSSALLGAAQLSSFGDLGTAALTARFNRLKVSKVLREGFSLMNPKNDADRLMAMKLGVAFDSAGARMRAANLLDAPGMASKMSETVIRASGLSAWTKGLRGGMAVTYLGELGERIGRDTFEQADAALSGQLSKYGIDAADWADLSRVGMDEWRGGKWLSAKRIMDSSLPLERREALVDKVLTLVETESNLAVPEPGVRSRAALRGFSTGVKRGTVAGEIVTSIGLFKSFAAEMVNGQIARGLHQGSAASKGAYLAQLVIATTALGAVSYQAKRIAKGQDAAEMDEKFLLAAMMQGGGLGLVGDFIVGAGEDRFGRGFFTSQLGPVAGLGDDILKLTMGNVGQVVRGEQADILPEAVQFIGRYAPGSSLWYTRLGFERILTDQMAMLADPLGARRSFAAKERFQRENFGAGYFHRPGQLLPDRFPKVGR